MTTKIFLLDVATNLRFSFMRITARYLFVRRIYRLLWRLNKSFVPRTKTLFPDADLKKIDLKLSRDGFSEGLYLPDDVSNRLVAFAMDNPCYGNYDSKVGFFYRDLDKIRSLGHRFMVAQYQNIIPQCDSIRILMQDPVLLGIARNYLGYEPQVVQPTLLWTLVNEDSCQEEKRVWGQEFHHDIDDFNFLKIFFRLNRVNDESAPTIFIRGSHRVKSIRHQKTLKRFSDEEMLSTYGGDNVVTILGNRGTGFVADTYGIHKAKSPTSKDRLGLQILYARNDYKKYSDYGASEDQSFILDRY